MSNKKKQKNVQMSQSPKSKAARQKLRRWTFVAEMALENGQKAGFNLPGLIYGNSHEAQLTAADLLKKFTDDPNAPQDVVVVPVGHETVSHQTKHQLQGLNDQSNLMTKTAFILAERVRLLLGSDKSVVELMDEAVKEAREHLFPRLKEAQLKMAAIDAPLEPAVESQQAELPQAQPEVEKPKRKLGIDAVNELLASPVSL